MEVAAIAEIIKTVGMSGVFLVGLVYLYRQQEAKEKRIASEVRDRETRLGKRLDATEEYIRTTQAEAIETQAQAIERNTAAMNELTGAMRNLQQVVISNGQHHEERRK